MPPLQGPQASRESGVPLTKGRLGEGQVLQPEFLFSPNRNRSAASGPGVSRVAWARGRLVGPACGQAVIPGPLWILTGLHCSHPNPPVCECDLPLGALRILASELDLCWTKSSLSLGPGYVWIRDYHLGKTLCSDDLKTPSFPNICLCLL